MKKREVIKLLPKLKAMKATIKKNVAAIARLSKETNKLEDYFFELDGVFLHENVPMRMWKATDTLTVEAAYDGNTRYASATLKNSKYTLNVYRGGAVFEDDGIKIDGEFTAKHAEKLAKDWVPHGQFKRLG